MNWVMNRLNEPTSKGAILFVGSSYVAIAQAWVMEMPIRFLIAGAVSTTFLGLMAFCYDETPDQIRSDTPKDPAP